MLTLLDTHALVWLDQDLPQLGPKARQRADAALKDGRLAVSAISFWEVAMLTQKARLTMAIPVSTWRRDLLRLGLMEIPLDGDIGIQSAQLDLHGDPADRIIVATAVAKSAALITADAIILGGTMPLERYDARS